MVGVHHGECGARAYDGGLRAEPPAGSRDRAPDQGARGRSPLEAESILVIGCPIEPANLASVRENSMLCYGPLVSELGGPRVHGAPHSVSALQNPYIMTQIFMKFCWHENFMDIYTETFAKGKMLRW